MVILVYKICGSFEHRLRQNEHRLRQNEHNLYFLKKSSGIAIGIPSSGDRAGRDLGWTLPPI